MSISFDLSQVQIAQNTYSDSMSQFLNMLHLPPKPNETQITKILDLYFNSVTFDLRWQDFIELFSGICFTVDAGYIYEYKYRVSTILPETVNRLFFEASQWSTKENIAALNMFKKTIKKNIKPERLCHFFSHGFSNQQFFNILAAHFCDFDQQQLALIADLRNEEISTSLFSAFLCNLPFEIIVNILNSNAVSTVQKIDALCERTNAEIYLPQQECWIQAQLCSEYLIDATGNMYSRLK